MAARAKRKSTEERQREIAEATLHFVAEHGVARLTTAAIAERVGIAEGTIFRHFDNKEAIILAAIAHLDEILLSNLPPPEGEPLARLGEFFTTRVPIIARNPGFARLIFSDELGREAGEAGLAAAQRVQERALSFVLDCLKEAQAKGQLREGLKPERLLMLVQGSALALVNFGSWLGTKSTLTERAQGVWQTFYSMMRR